MSVEKTGNKPEIKKPQKSPELKDSDLDKAVGGRMGTPANATVVTTPQ